MDGNGKRLTPPAANRFLELLRKMKFVKNYGVLLFLLLLIAVSALLNRNLLAGETLVSTLVQAFPIMLVALGMTMVMSSGGIDISVGAIMAISAAVSAWLYNEQIGLILSLCCGVLAAALCGLLNGVLVSKFKIQPIIVTLIVMFAGRAVAQMIVGEGISLMYKPFAKLAQYRIVDVPIQVVIMALAVGAMLLVAKKTVFAKHVEAIGENRTAARLVGINIFSVTVGVYVLCSILCAIAGMMEAAEGGGVNAKLGQYIELDAIAAVAIGGTRFSGGKARILGTVFGAIVVQLVPVIVGMENMAYEYSLIFKALVLIVAVWAQGEK